MQPFLLALKLISVFPVGDVEEADAKDTASYFPLAGFAVGLVMAVGGLLLIALMPLPVAAVVGGILIPVAYSALTRHHGLQGMAETLEKWFPDSDSAEGADRVAFYRNILIIQTLALVKFVFVGLVLYYRQPMWLALVPALSHCAWSDLLQPDSQNIDIPGNSGVRIRVHWVFAAVISLLAGALSGSLAAGILAPILTWLSIQASRTLLTERLGGIHPTGVYAVAEKMELLVLLVGILFFATATM